jgi:hypothetical protein
LESNPSLLGSNPTPVYFFAFREVIPKLTWSWITSQKAKIKPEWDYSPKGWDYSPKGKNLTGVGILPSNPTPLKLN